MKTIRLHLILIVFFTPFLAGCGKGCHNTEETGTTKEKEYVFEGRKSGGTLIKSTAPSNASPVTIQIAQGYISAFNELIPDANKFADSYVLEEDYVKSLKGDQAVRVFNSIDPTGNEFYSLFRMSVIGNTLDFVMGAPMYWMNNQCKGDDCLTGGGPIDQKHGDKPFVELKAASDKYIAEAQPRGARDIENSFVVKKAECDMVVAAAAPDVARTIRVYHAFDGTERVVIIVGVRDDGTTIWKDNAVFVGAVNHLCPTACDCLEPICNMQYAI